MFTLDQPEELIKMKLISSLKNNQIDSQKEIEKLFFLSHPDIVVVDKNQEIALLVDIRVTKTQPGESAAEFISQITQLYLENAKSDIRFAMLVNFEKINIFKSKSNSEKFFYPILSFDCTDIISHYDPEFRSRKILYLYFRTLIEAWLRDLAYRWKSEIPPGTQELAKIGLLAKIEDGDTYAQNE